MWTEIVCITKKRVSKFITKCLYRIRSRLDLIWLQQLIHGTTYPHEINLRVIFTICRKKWTGFYPLIKLCHLLVCLQLILFGKVASLAVAWGNTFPGLRWEKFCWNSTLQSGCPRYELVYFIRVFFTQKFAKMYHYFISSWSTTSSTISLESFWLHKNLDKNKLR